MSQSSTLPRNLKLRTLVLRIMLPTGLSLKGLSGELKGATQIYAAPEYAFMFEVSCFCTVWSVFSYLFLDEFRKIL
jgi:hypothetical protein